MRFPWFSSGQAFENVAFAGSQKENLLTCLADLFHNIATQKRKVSLIFCRFSHRLAVYKLHESPVESGLDSFS